MHCLSIYLLSILLIPSLATYKCFSCASPELEENWQITNFPKKPDNLKFITECSSDTNIYLNQPCSQGVCYEAIIPFNNKATYLRGCYQDFMDDANLTSASLSTPICTFGPMDKDVFFVDDKNLTSGQSPAYAASHFCVNSADSCNTDLTYKTSLFSDPADYFKKCTNPGTAPQKQCISCTHSGGEGECNPDATTTCRGAFCVKYEGYLNGDAVVVRTCSPTSPFPGDQCEYIDNLSEFNLFGVSLKLPYKAWHCYCSGDSCNPSSPISSSLFISVILPLFISRFIPFFSV